MKKVFGFIFLMGILVLFGTAGASDMGVITERETFVRSCLGLAMVVSSFFAGRLWEV